MISLFGLEVSPRKRDPLYNRKSVFKLVHMKIFSWNVRGLNNNDRQRSIRSWLNNFSSSVGAFLETHVREENSVQVSAGCLQGWRFDSNYSEIAGGRIWIVWDPVLSVVVFKKSEQMIVRGVFEPETQTALTVGFVYA